MSIDSRKLTVQTGYDELALRYGQWAASIEGDPWERFLGELAARLDDGARVLDLGCGNGAKTERLAERFEVLGVDISAEQLRRARESVPQATFIRGDFAQLDFEGPFDGVTAFYSIIHVPREEHERVFSRIARLLSPGGLFLASLSAGCSKEWTGNWLGVEMFFSGYEADTNRCLLREAGFDLLLDDVVTIREPEGEASFLWVLGRKP